MKTIEILLVILYSALFGGLLTVIAHRLPFMMLEPCKKYNLFFPGSQCPHCKIKILWQHKLPIIGYFLTTGRCHSCHEKISLQYLLTEIIFTLLILSIFMLYGFNLHFLFLMIFMFLGTALFLIDMRYGILPDSLVFTLWAVGLIAATFNVFVDSNQAIMGCILGFVTAYAIAKVYQHLRGKEGLGFGDVKLFSALGAWLGPFALPFILLEASILLLGYATIKMAITTHKKNIMNLKIAFGPFLIIAAAILLLIKPQLRMLLLHGA